MNPSSPDEAWAAMRESGAPEWVLGHVAKVEALAVAMAEAARRAGRDVDADLVRVAAILHDLGRSQTQDIHHARLGADLAAQAGWPDDVVRIIRRHTGAGITDEEAARLGLPPGPYVPETLEEKIVAHADNLYTGDKRQTLRALAAKYESRGHHEAVARVMALEEELGAALGIGPEALADGLDPPPSP